MDNEVIEGLKLSTWLNGTPRESIHEMYERDKDKPLSEFLKQQYSIAKNLDDWT